MSNDIENSICDMNTVHGCVDLIEFRAKYPELDLRTVKFYFDKYRFISSNLLSEKQKKWLIDIDTQILNITDLRKLRANLYKMKETEQNFVMNVKPNFTPKQREWINRLIKKYT